MKMVKYEDFPGLCDQLLHEVEMTRVTIQVVKGGKPIARLEPVDDATKALYEARSTRRAGRSREAEVAG
jgi:antitoxin (DNA-binding transcriptional repressor) of toxin-antitoxin stability system